MDIQISWQLSKGEAEFIQFVCDAIIDEVNIFIKVEAPELTPLDPLLDEGIVALCDVVQQSTEGGSKF